MKWLERLVERPPRFFRALFPGALFRLDSDSEVFGPPASDGAREKTVYLTFDDGPIPEVTPKVLDILDRYGVKATFFMVGENVKRHPELLVDVRARGHSCGNHTLHHMQGAKVSLEVYLEDVRAADALIGSTLFRPPHGWLRPSQLKALRKTHHMVMYDLVTRDYASSLTPERVLENVMELARPGSIIVFHDSLKSWPRLKEALPRAIEWLFKQGYALKSIPESPIDKT